MTYSMHHLLSKAEKWLPILFPFLLIFSRSLADFTVVFTGVLFLIRSDQQQDWRWLNEPWLKAGLPFLLYLLFINSPLSIAPLNSFLYALSYMRWPLFACALGYWIFQDTTRQRQFIYILCIVCMFVMLDSTFQYFTGQDIFGLSQLPNNRLSGPFHSPLPGIMMLRVLFIAIFIVYFHPFFKTISRTFWSLTMFILICTIFMMMTGERMALMLFLLGAVTILIAYTIEQKIKKSTVFYGFSIIALSATTLLLLAPITRARALYSITEKLGHFWQSDYGFVFMAAIKAWQAHPLLGSGLHTYRQVCTDMGLLQSWGFNCSHTHNLYLQIGAETGIIGLILFVLYIISIYIFLLKPHILNKAWFTFCLVLTMLNVCFLPFIGGISILNNGVAALVWLGVGWGLSLRNGVESKLLL